MFDVLVEELRTHSTEWLRRERERLVAQQRNLRTREMRIAGQTASGSGLWHVNGSSDGRWAVGDDFSRSLYLIDRNTSEMIMLTTGHKPTAADHPHPTFSPDNTRIEIQSAMLSADNRSMNICVVPVPKAWLDRKYTQVVEK